MRTRRTLLCLAVINASLGMGALRLSAADESEASSARASASAQLSSTSNPAGARSAATGNLGGILIRRLSPPGTFWVDGVAYSSDGKWLVTHRDIDSKFDTIFEAATGAPNKTLDKVEPMGHSDVRISSDSRFCALRSYPPAGESNVKVYRLPEFSLVRTFRDVDATSGEFFWMPDNKSLLVQNYTKLSIWSVETGEMTSTFPTSGALKVKAISRDGRYIASALASPQTGGAHEMGYRIEILPVGDPSRKVSFVAHKQWIAALEFSPDSGILASAASDKMIKLWSVPDGKLIRTLEGHDWVVKAVRFASGGKTLVSGCIDQTIRFWDVASGTPIGSYSMPDVAITSLDLSPDELTIALGAENGKVTILDYAKLKAQVEQAQGSPAVADPPRQETASGTAAAAPAPTPPVADESLEPWAKDWSAFVKKVASEADADIFFVGERVIWTGKVTKIEPAKSAADSGVISLAMKSEKLKLRFGTYTIDTLSLKPTVDEWTTWQPVSDGDTVSFTTTLDNQDPFGQKKVFLLFNGVGSNAGKNFVMVTTKGGSCLKIESRGKK